MKQLKKIFFFILQPSVFLIFVKVLTPVFIYFWLINLWRYYEHVFWELLEAYY